MEEIKDLPETLKTRIFTQVALTTLFIAIAVNAFIQNSALLGYSMVLISVIWAMITLRTVKDYNNIKSAKSKVE